MSKDPNTDMTEDQEKAEVATMVLYAAGGPDDDGKRVRDYGKVANAPFTSWPGSTQARRMGKSMPQFGLGSMKSLGIQKLVPDTRVTSGRLTTKRSVGRTPDPSVPTYSMSFVGRSRALW